jgi:hypothetical protein
VTRALLRDALRKIDSLSARMDPLEQQEPEEIVYPPGCEPESEEPKEPAEPTEDEDSADPPDIAPTGDLHTVPAKPTGHVRADSTSVGLERVVGFFGGPFVAHPGY